eukprot:3158331-Ditylum_brightwellii.AAC.1
MLQPSAVGHLWHMKKKTCVSYKIPTQEGYAQMYKDNAAALAAAVEGDKYGSFLYAIGVVIPKD